MSIRLLNKLGILFLLIIIFVTTALAIHHTNTIKNQLDMVVNVHAPTIDTLYKLSELVNSTNYKFEIFLQQTRVHEHELISIIEQIQDILFRAKDATYGDIDSIISNTTLIKQNLQKVQGLSAKEDIHSPHQTIQAQLTELRQQVGYLYRHPENKDNLGSLKALIKQTGSLISGLEMRLSLHTDESLLHVNDITAPLDELLGYTTQLNKAIAYERQRMENDTDSSPHQHHDNFIHIMNNDIGQLISLSNRLKYAIQFYTDTEKKTDPSAAPMLTSVALINDLRDELLAVVDTMRSRVDTHIRSDEQTFVENTESNQTLLISFSIIALFTAFCIELRNNRVVANAITHLVTGVQRIASGNLQQRIEKLQGKEFQEIALAINHMAHKIEEKNSELNQHVKLLDLANNEIARTNEALEKTVTKRTQALQQALNDAQQANTAKSEFLANISHELRTPMHAILSFSSLGIDKVDTAPKEKLARYYTNIHKSGSHLLVMINDLLDLSKLESGKMEFDFEPHPITKLAKTVCSELSPLFKEKQMQLELIQDNPNITAHYDLNKLIQVLRNLLSNALKFTPEGKTIRVSIIESKLPIGRRKNDTTPVPGILFTVSDEGTGIPNDELEAVFDKFIQSSKTRTGAGGTGLGLSISKEIIEGHQGKIWASNNTAGGADFFFFIPLTPPDA